MMRRAWLLVLLGCCMPFWLRAETLEAADVDAAVLEAEAARVAVMAEVEPTVLAVFDATGSDGGSGVVISPDGYALTNFHVTAGAGVAMKCGMADGRLYDAVIVGIDPTGDVSLIKLLGRDDFPAARLGDSDRVRPGDWVFAMGNPFLLATDFRPTVTYGIVSGVHRYQYPAGTLLEYADCIQTDAAINPGNSGGPLFNAAGELIGINGRGSFEKRGRVSVGVGYAISINQIKNFLGYLKSGRIVDHATLGATVRTDADGRVVVVDVLDTSDAWRRGLRPGDEILRFGGRTVHSANSLKNALGIFPKGWRVPLSFVHRGERHDVYVRLAGVHREGELAKRLEGRRRREMPGLPKDEKDKQRPGDGRRSDKRPAGGEPDNQQPPNGDARDHDANRREKQQTTPQAEGRDPKESRDERPRPTDDEKPLPVEGEPQHGRKGKQRLPEVVRPYYEARHGYANYYFNRLAQQRVVGAILARGNYTGIDGPWTIEGKLAGGGRFAMRLEGRRASVLLPGGEAAISVTQSLNDALDPPGSGGLLAALWLWRTLLAHGPQALDEFYYLGTAPLPDDGRLYDVLVALHAGAECRYWIDADRAEVVALEFSPADEVDPCEVRFQQYEEADGHLVPRRIEVRYGDVVYGVFLPERFDLTSQESAP